MSDIKHLVFSPNFQGLRTSYQVKEAGADALLFEGIPVGFWLNSLDVFQGAVSAGRKAFTIKPYRIWWSSHHVFVSEDEVLGTVVRENMLSHDWVILDASTRIVGNICRTAASRANFFSGEYQIKIDKSDGFC